MTFSRGAPKVAASLTMSLSSKYDISILMFHHPDKIYPFKGKYFSINEKHRFSHLIIRLIKLYYAIKFISPDIKCKNAIPNKITNRFKGAINKAIFEIF